MKHLVTPGKRNKSRSNEKLDIDNSDGRSDANSSLGDLPRSSSRQDRTKTEESGGPDENGYDDENRTPVNPGNTPVGSDYEDGNNGEADEFGFNKPRKPRKLVNGQSNSSPQKELLARHEEHLRTHELTRPDGKPYTDLQSQLSDYDNLDRDSGIFSRADSNGSDLGNGRRSYARHGSEEDFSNLNGQLQVDIADNSGK